MGHLEIIKINLCKQIDEAAGRSRSQFITTSPGQESVYQEKVDEATDYRVDGMPEDLSGYPFIEADVIATGHTPEVVIETIFDKRSEWVRKGAQIEIARRSGKIGVNAADNELECIEHRNAALLALTVI